MSESERRFSLPEKGTPWYEHKFLELMFDTDPQYVTFMRWAFPRFKGTGGIDLPRTSLFTAIRVKPWVLDNTPPGLLEGLREITESDLERELESNKDTPELFDPQDFEQFWDAWWERYRRAGG